MPQVHQSVLDLAQARLGKVVRGKWRVERLLGVGGMASVYAATHVKNGARVALKMLHPQLSVSEEIRKRFSREGYVANTVGHPGVPRVLDDDTAEDGAAFLVMDLLEGETADQRASRSGGKLSPQEVAAIGEAILDVLAAAHARGIIHRDIKPENVFLTTDQRVILLDFGIARVIDTSAIGGGTNAGTMMGTPAFMPPEQARGRANEMDATSDVWAVGATLFHLLSGRVVHVAETTNEQLVAAATLPAPSLGHVASGVPTPLVDVVDRALAYAKEARYPDARAMQAALRSAIDEISWGGKLPRGFNLAARPVARPSTPGPLLVVTPSASGGFPAAAGSSGALPAQAQARLAPTVLTSTERAPHPTLGPLELADRSPRTARLAFAIGAGVASALVLGGVLLFFLGRTPDEPASPGASVTSNAPPPSPTVASASPSALHPGPSVTVAPPPPITSASVTAATVTSTTKAVPHLPAAPTATGKDSWLDRRK